MIEKTASVHWEGPGKRGKGQISTETGALDRYPYGYRHFPLVEVHRNAELAAEAAEAAAAQGQFWPIHHLLFAQAHHLTPAALAGYAQSLGLDMNRFNAEMGDRIYTQRIQEHRGAGECSSLRATPAFFLNGTVVDVSFGLEKLDEAVQAALKAA
jgi:protein-disulfide isomerase